MDEVSEKTLLIAAVIVAVVLSVTATAAVMSTIVMKPFVLEFTFAEPEVKAESIVFIYNAGTWMGANVALKNYASGDPQLK